MHSSGKLRVVDAHVHLYDSRENRYEHLERVDAMFEALEKALEERTSALVRLRVDPRFDNLRSDSRFQALLQRVRPAV